METKQIKAGRFINVILGLVVELNSPGLPLDDIIKAGEVCETPFTENRMLATLNWLASMEYVQVRRDGSYGLAPEGMASYNHLKSQHVWSEGCCAFFNDPAVCEILKKYDRREKNNEPR